jgi:uncharacterized protein (TIGR02611 family)
MSQLEPPLGDTSHRDEPGHGEPRQHQAPPDEPKPTGWERRYRAFRRSMQSNPVLDLSWRIGVLTIGAVVLIAGIAMLALPGPGWAAIFLGLLILASEFTWARRSLDWARDRAKAAKEQALSPELRRRNQVIAVVVAVVVAVAVWWYWQRYGFPGPVGAWIGRTVGT